MFEDRYQDGRRELAKRVLHGGASVADEERDSERMKICARWRAAGATPAMRESYYLQRQQVLAGEPLL